MKPDFKVSFPVEYHVSKKNNRPIFGRGEKKWIGKSDRLKKAEAFLTLIFKSVVARSSTAPLKGDIHATFRFYFKDYFTKDGHRSKRLPDLSNLIQLPEDCLQTAGVIENDTDIVSLDGSGRFPGDDNRLEIELRVINDGLFGQLRGETCQK